MVHRRQTCPGASTCSSDCQRRRNRSVSGGKYFAPLVTRLAAKHRMLVSRRRRLPLSVNIVNRASTSPVSPPPSSPPPTMAPVLLAEAPAEYVRDKLHLFKKCMLSGLRDVRLISAPQRSGFLPKEIQILMSDDSSHAVPPTHMLAVYAPKSTPTSSRTKVTLYPTHEIVLSSHCTNLPKLPEPSSSSSIPVIPLAIPSPSMYPYLQTYLYTKDASMLETVLLPTPSQALDSSSLMRRLLAVHGLWGNASALGVIDPPFYSMIERVWATLHETLSRIHASSS
ncbi:hypothetical protein AGABI1DRAFT_115223 [Agaricus bisporus var. burnettii JB137-S8]|uniref:Uncharacterized protein n=1 Tax=Agaricus bisporus var. burnettii (strain JB137-S8 / ATCC MYA-4627 / FGSC 10392) TaxID=597362 RepID=K5X2Z6_AGABU|nr:uncharacterized protein AGABI1DRAFT_115223 [Agaricus bisporus var. burnettii JB137-S8]EKM77287.1 hypothetical protein AGABI1DRAFT_115223 [Agaricus bisporus var. burnettii JB137-S8]